MHDYVTLFEPIYLTSIAGVVRIPHAARTHAAGAGGSCAAICIAGCGFFDSIFYRLTSTLHAR